jgi:hypothetical protein
VVASSWASEACKIPISEKKNEEKRRSGSKSSCDEVKGTFGAGAALRLLQAASAPAPYRFAIQSFGRDSRSAPALGLAHGQRGGGRRGGGREGQAAGEREEARPLLRES